MKNFIGQLLKVRSGRCGLTFIEVLVVTVAVAVILTGAYQFYLRSENRQAEERRIATASTDMRRIKEGILRELSKIYDQLETMNYGLIYGENGSVPVAAEAGNAIGNTDVTPDKLIFISPVNSRGIFPLGANLNPDGATITIKTNRNGLPDFVEGDIIMITSANSFMLTEITTTPPPVITGSGNTATKRYTLAPYNSPLFPFTSYQHVKNGQPIFDPALMGDIASNKGTVRAVHIYNYFTAVDPDSDKLILYRKVDRDDPNAKEMIGAGLHDFQVSYALDGNHDVLADDVTTMAEAQRVSSVKIQLNAATKERSLEGFSGMVSLRAGLGGNIFSDLKDINALPTAHYAANELPGPAALVPNGINNGPATVRAKLVFNHTTGAVSGGLLFFDENGNSYTPPNNPVLPQPIVGVTRDPHSKQVFATLAPNQNSDGTTTLSVLTVTTDGAGNISQTSTIGQENIGVNINDISGATFGIPNSSGNQKIYLTSTNTSVLNDPTNPIPGASPMARYFAVVQRTVTGNSGGPITPLGNPSGGRYWINFPPDASPLVAGLTTVKIDDNYVALLLVTTPVKVGNELKRGFLYGIGLNPTTGKPFSYDESNFLGTNEVKAVPFAEFTEGPVFGMYPVYAGNDTEPSSLAIDTYTNTLMMNLVSVSDMVKDYLFPLNSTPTPVILGSVTKIDNVSYCSNRLTAASLNPAYMAAAGVSQFEIMPPIVKSTMMIDLQNGKPPRSLFTSGLATGQDLSFTVPLDRLYASAVRASIKPYNNGEIPNYSTINLAVNAANASDVSNQSEGKFIRLIPDDALGTPCAANNSNVWMPELPSATGSASDLMLLAGAFNPNAPDILLWKAPGKYFWGTQTGYNAFLAAGGTVGGSGHAGGAGGGGGPGTPEP